MTPSQRRWALSDVCSTRYAKGPIILRAPTCFSARATRAPLQPVLSAKGSPGASCARSFRTLASPRSSIGPQRQRPIRRIKGPVTRGGYRPFLCADGDGPIKITAIMFQSYKNCFLSDPTHITSCASISIWIL